MKEGRFLVTHVDEASATLRDVENGQVITLAENPDLEVDEVLEASVRPEPPLEVAYEVVEIEDRRTIPVERVDLEPTRLAQELAADQPVGDLTTRERAGTGEVHVLTVDAEGIDAAAADVATDEATVERAARLDVVRVEIRAGNVATDDGDVGVVSVRYLPD